jgi:hypothetical protein
MAEESFEDDEIAALLKDTFICIKVDREERPDVDSVYMTAAQLITGTGGWPLTIFMTSDKQPFFAATYLPKHARFGQPGLMELIPRIRELSTTDREELLSTAGRLTYALQNMPQPSDELPDRATLDEGYRQLHASFDTTHGGFHGAPKFPTPHRLLLLLRYWRRTATPEALKMVEATLQAMHHGGMYDHLGGGFHRYATDARWRVPHFEKMLYDQALLVLAYIEAYQATTRPQYAEVARETLEYVLRDLQHPQGGFSAAEDADSPEGEGAFYRWTKQDIEAILGDQAELFFQAYNVSNEGTMYRIASDEQLREQLLEARQRLYRARNERTRPAQDDKILADWNGLMIAALARAGQVFDNERYIMAAERAAGFIWQHLHDDGGIRHRYRDGHVSQQCYASDAAFYIWGLIELYLATFTPVYLQRAIQVQEEMLQQFWETENAGFYLTAHDSETPLVRSMPTEDGAVPSANAVAMYNLLRLGHLTGDQRWHDRAEQLRALATPARQWPTAHTMWLSALELAYGTSHEIVITAPKEKEAISAIRFIQRQYLPHTVILFKREGIADVAPFTRDMPEGDTVTFYVCTGQTCRAPTTDISVVLDELDLPLRHDLAEP